MAKEENKNHVEVEVTTTSGSYPEEGLVRIPIHQKVKIVLKKAADELGITSTDRWVAKVQGREINPELSFEENNISGTAVIDYGPREGGGGK